MASEESDSVTATAPPKKAHTFACVRCSERKVKCDRQEPCNACVRHSAECIFRAPKPPRRRKNYTKEETTEQLKRYETLLRANGIDPGIKDHPSIEHDHAREASSKDESPIVSPPSIEHAINQMPTPSSVTSPPEVRQSFKPQLLQGQNGTKFVDNSLWSRVAQEIRDGGGSLEDDSDSSDDGNDTERPHQDLLSVFNQPSPISLPSHPAPDTIRRLWRIFIENVNPIFKFLHIPTVSKAIEKAIANIDRIPRGFEALMFAMYAVSTLSLPVEDCREEFGASRSTLLHRYVTATQNALLRAKFMSTTSSVVLQALLLHLIAIRERSEPRAVWNLTGLVIRIAEGMGMRIDGTALGLPPFETEMRRRLWWQLSVHDFRCAEMAGQAKFRAVDADKGAPEPPTNCDDSALWPGMTKMPESAVGATEMLWVMFRTELSGFARGQIARMKKAGVKPDVTPEEFLIMDDLEHKDRLIKQVEDVMETKYLRYCDPTQPLHLFTLLGTRGALKLMKFMCHHPRRWAHLDHVPDEEVQLIWDLTSGILEYYHAMQTNPSIRRFKWNVSYFIQWHAVIHVLDTLRTTPMREDAEKVWALIDSLYEHNSHIMLSTHRPVFMAVGNLCLKAVEAREQAFENAGRLKPKWPAYVDKLRQQREAARARREAVASAKGKSAKPMPQTTLPASVNPAWTNESNASSAPGLPSRESQGGASNNATNSYDIPQRPLQASSSSTTNNSTPITTLPNTSSNQNAFQYYNATPMLVAPSMSSFDNPWPDLASATSSQAPTNSFDHYMMFDSQGQPSADTEMLDPDLVHQFNGTFDADAILAQGFSLDAPDGQVVDWAQWDNFFGTTTGPTLGVGAGSGVGWDLGPATAVGWGQGGAAANVERGEDRRSLR